MPKLRPLEIRCNDAGFVLATAESSAPHTSSEWRDVNAILAYKRELYMVDLMCLGFVTPERSIEVHEDMQGWSELVEQLPSRLPDVPPSFGLVGMGGETAIRFLRNEAV
jgi:hypothetical protein